MSEDTGTFTKCPDCGERIDPREPGVVYAVPREEVATMGPTYTMVDGIGGYFHEWCSPEALGYERRPHSAR
jgi:hypothetical protein